MSDSDLDVRRRLAAIEEHQLRADRLLMEIQLEGRKRAREQAERAREQAERETAIDEKLSHLIELLTATVSNGHHP